MKPIKRVVRKKRVVLPISLQGILYTLTPFLFLTLLILLLDWLPPTFYKMDGFMTVREIDVEFADQARIPKEISTDSIRNNLSEFIGQSLYRVTSEKIRERLRKNPWINGIVVKRKLPSRLVVRIEIKVPRYLLSEDELFYLDENGDVITSLLPHSPVNLPIISGKREKFMGNIEFINKIEKKLSHDGYTISEIFVDDFGFFNFLLSGEKYLLKFRCENLDVQFQRFKTIIDDLRERKIKSCEIDLTYEKFSAVKRLS